MRQLAAAGRRDFYEGDVAAGIAKDVKRPGRRARRRGPAPLPGAHRRAARDRVPRRGARARAGAHRRPQHAARAARPAPRALPPQRAARRRVPRLRPGAARRLLRPARHHGRGEPTERAADEHDASQRDRPAGQHGRADADAAVGLRIQGGAALLRHPDEQRHHVVRPAPGLPQLHRARASARSPTCARVIASRDGKPWFAIGASGGRKIFPAVLQIVVVPDRPRDAPRGRVPPAAHRRERGRHRDGRSAAARPWSARRSRTNIPSRPAELVVYPTNYACPSAVLHDAESGENFGVADVMSPWSGAVAEEA